MDQPQNTTLYILTTSPANASQPGSAEWLICQKSSHLLRPLYTSPNTCSNRLLSRYGRQNGNEYGTPSIIQNYLNVIRNWRFRW